MKKMILSIAVIVSMFLMTNLNIANANNQPVILNVTEDDGYVEVKLEDLNEKVQSAIQEISATYEVSNITYNVEKKITKVKAKNKADQTEKVFKFDDDGIKVQHENKNRELEKAKEQTEIKEQTERKENETHLPQW